MLPSRLPYSGAHWVDHVARHAFAVPNAVTIRFEGWSITWAELHGRVRNLAAGLAGQGVRPGDRVAILMTNRPEFVESVLAANAVGAIAVPVNFRLAPAEAAYILQDSGATLIVTDSSLAPLAAPEAEIDERDYVVDRKKDMIISGGEKHKLRTRYGHPVG
jgi:fatty-acyl-CoA synthase